MPNENLIHVKLEFEEGIEGKRDILRTKADLIELRKTINQYNFLRQKELKIKIKIRQKIKKLITNIKKLQTELPKIKIQENSLTKEIPNSNLLREKIKDKKNQTGLDRELAEIQERLRELGR